MNRAASLPPTPSRWKDSPSAYPSVIEAKKSIRLHPIGNATGGLTYDSQPGISWYGRIADDHPYLTLVAAGHGVQIASGGSSPFYVMEMCDESLRVLMQRGIAPANVLPLFSQILDGVEAAHVKGVVHRDLKPENVLYRHETGQAAIADFGVARFSAEELATAIETRPGTRLANFQYAAPEQRMRNQRVGVGADIYALGLLLNELFTGQIPHGTGYRKIGDVAADHAWLDPIVESMLRQDPASRPISSEALKRRGDKSTGSPPTRRAGK